MDTGLPSVVRDISVEDLEALRIYKEEVARGLVHTEDWCDRMTMIEVKVRQAKMTEEEVFAEWMRRNGFQRGKNGGWFIGGAEPTG